MRRESFSVTTVKWNLKRGKWFEVFNHSFKQFVLKITIESSKYKKY